MPSRTGGVRGTNPDPATDPNTAEHFAEWCDQWGRDEDDPDALNEFHAWCDISAAEDAVWRREGA